MIHEGQRHPEVERERREIAEQCSGCGADVLAAPGEGGLGRASLTCARCGQWHVLCEDCMPKNVSEYSRDAAWLCPECQGRPLDA